MTAITRSRWFRCRSWKLVTMKTFLILVLCCIVLKITFGLPTYEQQVKINNSFFNSLNK